MEKRKKKIIDLLNNSIHSKNIKIPNHKLDKDSIDEIKNNFDELKHCMYINPTSLKPRDLIRYIDKKKQKVSITGIVMYIEHYSLLDISSEIKSIHLYNTVTSTTWKINPKNFYLFKVYRLKKNEQKIYGILKFFQDELDKYKKKMEG